MKDKCLNCPYYLYVTDENRDKICYNCNFEDVVNEFKIDLKETWLYKFIVNVLD